MNAAEGSAAGTDGGTGRGDAVTQLVHHLASRGETVATAESLTGGLVVATLVDVPGASAVVRGGIVAYHSDLKSRLVGVSADLLAAGGAVQEEVAIQLAAGARERFQATWGIGTTGIAGPEPSDGKPVGTVYVAVCGPGTSAARELSLSGSREAIRRAAVEAALDMLARTSGLAI